MANIKVSEMTEATLFEDDDYAMILQANQNKKITKQNMLQSIDETIGDLSELNTTQKDSVVNAINSIITDFIVEQGTDPNWSYRKWNSGIAEAWCTKQITASFPSNKNWGAFFESSSRVDQFNFPTGLFIDIPALQISPSAVSGMAISGYETSANITKDVTPRVYVLRPISTTETGTFNINYYALGNWK